MALSTQRTPQRSTSFRRFLAIFCIIIFVPLAIATVIVLGLIPVYLNNRSVSTTRTSVGPPFNVTYVLVEPSTRSTDAPNLNGMDPVKMARDFERGLGISIRNILKINYVTPDMAMGKEPQSRRKRSVQCDRDLRGPTLNFQFNLNYPITRACQTQKCIDRVFAEIYEKFRTVLSVFVTIGNTLRELRLCFFNAIPSRTTRTSTTSTEISPATSSSTGPGSSTTDIINPNSTTNGSFVDRDVCLLKIPFIQESVPPYRIIHTSTVYFQDESSLIVAGASKFEASIQMGANKQQIKINGVIVNSNCQRTIDVSIPEYCYYPLPSSANFTI